MKRVSAVKRASKSSIGKNDGVKNAGDLRQEIEDLVKRHAVTMVKSAITDAKDGHYAAMKYLFEMISLFPAANEAESAGNDSLAKILLERLGMSDVLSGVSAAAKEISTTNDAVE